MQTRNFLTLCFVGSWSIYAWTADLSEPHESNLVDSSPNKELVTFVLAAVDNNPRILAAQATLKASDALKSASNRPLYNPEIEVEAINAEVETRTIGISQTFDFGNKRSALGAIANADLKVAQSEYFATRQTVTLEILLALSAYQTSKGRDDLANERVEALKDFYVLAKQRFDAGDLSQTEFNLASLLAAQARLSKAVAASDLSNATGQIRGLVSDIDLTQIPMLDLSFPIITKLESRLSNINSLPELQASQMRVDSANATVDLRRREQRPDPTISLIGGEEGKESLVGFSLSIALPVRNNRSAEVTAASEYYQQAWQESDNLFSQAKARLINASERYRIAQSAWSDWQQFGQLSLDNQTVQLDQLWKGGELSTSEFLVQLSQTIDSEDSALALRQTLWDTWFEWLAASNQIDQWIALNRDPNQI